MDNEPDSDFRSLVEIYPIITHQKDFGSLCESSLAILTDSRRLHEIPQVFIKDPP